MARVLSMTTMRSQKTTMTCPECAHVFEGEMLWPDDLFPDGPQMCCSGIDCCCRGLPVDFPWFVCPGCQHRFELELRGMAPLPEEKGVLSADSGWGKYRYQTVTVGTSYFVSMKAAVEYYMPYEGNDWNDALTAVEHKLAQGDIHIGKPPLQPGDKLLIIDEGTRYAIQEAKEPELGNPQGVTLISGATGRVMGKAKAL